MDAAHDSVSDIPCHERSGTYINFSTRVRHSLQQKAPQERWKAEGGCSGKEAVSRTGAWVRCRASRAPAVDTPASRMTNHARGSLGRPSAAATTPI